MQTLLASIVPRQVCLSMQTEAEPLDLRRCHWGSMLPNHLSKVLWKSIELLLEEEKGSTKGTQLPFINSKGEFSHLIISASMDKL